jgi:hypothetical protein
MPPIRLLIPPCRMQRLLSFLVAILRPDLVTNDNRNLAPDYVMAAAKWRLPRVPANSSACSGT